ncbi:hypothetical protein BDV12DRAFT_192148 [Aspergillus spectabilis]
MLSVFAIPAHLKSRDQHTEYAYLARICCNEVQGSLKTLTNDIFFDEHALDQGIFGLVECQLVTVNCDTEYWQECVQNWDWLEGLASGTVVLDVALTKEENGVEKSFFTLPEPGLVGKIRVNSSGLGVCLNALRCGAFAAERLPTHIIARYILERTESFNEAVGMIDEYGGACMMNMLLADTEANFATVEVTPFGISVLRPVFWLRDGGEGKSDFYYAFW